MPEAHTSEVIRDTVAIIDQVLRIFLLWHEHERTHIKACQREFNECVDLLSTAEAELIPAGLEALEADDHDAGDAVDLQRFRRLHVLLTLIAVPLVIFIERLGLLELLQALI